MKNPVYFFISVLILFMGGLAISFYHREGTKTVEIVHFDWDSSIITSEIVKALLEKELGYKVKMISTFPAAGWAAIGTSMADVCVCAWLPGTHKTFHDNLKGQVEILSRCTEGLQVGLAVPSYVPCHSIDDLKACSAHFNGQIHGIETGAGVMIALEAALKTYGLNEYEIVEGSEALMLASVSEAIKRSEWIVFTAWSPHHMFQMFDIKYLEDSQNVFGDKEHAAIISRKAFQKDCPDAYALLSEVSIDKSDIEKMQHEMRINKTPAQVLAHRWVEQHQVSNKPLKSTQD
jgi:glycine betaine/proline transport system substrate-binding protein